MVFADNCKHVVVITMADLLLNQSRRDSAGGSITSFTGSLPETVLLFLQAHKKF
jgi:hypothetical protein